MSSHGVNIEDNNTTVPDDAMQDVCVSVRVSNGGQGRERSV